MNKGKSYFGTDGIRGRVGEPPITVDFLLKLGWAVGKAFANQERVNVLIGKDTRISGYLIESALQAGFSAAGANVYLAGPMPTPAIAYLTQTIRAQVGVVISASHNSYEDNGVKFFNDQGFKINKQYEDAINQFLQLPIETVSSKDLGKSWRVQDAEGRYIEFCKSSIPHQTNLKNMKIVIDCANGATYETAPLVFYELGAEVIPIHVSPDGFNINSACGSTHPTVIQKATLEHGADLGIALDGDGDRVIMVDSKGEILDGDEILYIIAKNMLSDNRLTGGIVGTIMSNLGLELALNDLGLAFIRVPVGDQNIVEALLQRKWVLGGEASGHIICLNVNTTGDGIIAALQVLLAMKSTGLSLHDLKKNIIKFPQKVINISLNNTNIDLPNSRIESAIKQYELELGKNGRIVLRKSGTEPLIRLMVEGQDHAKIETISNELEKVIKEVVTHS